MGACTRDYKSYYPFASRLRSLRVACFRLPLPLPAWPRARNSGFTLYHGARVHRRVSAPRRFFVGGGAAARRLVFTGGGVTKITGGGVASHRRPYLSDSTVEIIGRITLDLPAWHMAPLNGDPRLLISSVHFWECGCVLGVGTSRADNRPIRASRRCRADAAKQTPHMSSVRIL